MSVGGPRAAREPVGLPPWSSMYYLVLLASTKLDGAYWYCGFESEVVHARTPTHTHTHLLDADVAPVCVHRNLWRCVEGDCKLSWNSV